MQSYALQNVRYLVGHDVSEYRPTPPWHRLEDGLQALVEKRDSNPALGVGSRLSNRVRGEEGLKKAPVEEFLRQLATL